MSWMVSADSHVVEPPDLWSSRLPEHFRPLAPHVTTDDEGVDRWVVHGKVTSKVTNSLVAAQGAGLRFEGDFALNNPDLPDPGANLESMRKGGYIPEAHIAENESDGVWASVIYPTMGLMAFGIPDSAACSAAAAVYNDWVAEFCAVAPDRLKGVAMINLDSIPEAIEELTRVRNLGLTGALISASPARKYDDVDFYEPFWSAVEDLDVVLSIHIGSNRKTEELARQMSLTGTSTAEFWIRESIGHLIFSGTFMRHPSLRVVSVEYDAGWAPFFLERMDRVYLERMHRDAGGPVSLGDGMKPSDYWHQNCFVSFQEDYAAVRLRDVIGVGNLCWGSDYPHSESTFPRSVELLDGILEGVPAEDRSKITTTNAAALYGIDVPASR